MAPPLAIVTRRDHGVHWISLASMKQNCLLSHFVILRQKSLPPAQKLITKPPESFC